MFTSTFRKQTGRIARVGFAISAAFAVCCGSGAPDRGEAGNSSSSEFVTRPKPPDLRDASEPTCRIRFLTREERLHPDPANPRLVPPEEIEHPYPEDQADNPVLLQNRFAVLRFDNTTGRAVHAYLHGWEAMEEDVDTLRDVREMERAVIKMRTFKSEKARQHALKSLDAPRHSHPAQGAFTTHVELQSSDGVIIRVPDHYAAGCLQFSNWPPQAEHFRSGLHPTRTVQPGECVELHLSIFEPLRHQKDGLRPGVYTVRTTVAYAEAPGGETKRLTSDPVTVTVTEEHIKAAEVYREAAKN